MSAGVVLAHDYATQHGGAERVALRLAEAFPGSPLYVTLYDPPATFPEFAELDLRPSRLDRIALLRRHHRLALPLLASAIDAQRIDADVLVASSSGWAHGYRGARHTVVYCHAPARWLYQRDRYLSGRDSAGMWARGRSAAAGAALDVLTQRLRRWDADAAGRADRYLANSTVTQRAIASVYGIEAEVLPPPPALLPAGAERAVAGLAPGFLLCVARLLPYKNVDVVIRAAQHLDVPLVVVGEGPDGARLASIADRSDPRPGRVASGALVRLLGRVQDDELRWLYRNSSLLVGASYEDFGLSPLEAATFGRPSVVLRDGGYLDTVLEWSTGTFFDSPEPDQVAAAIEKALEIPWDPVALADHAASFAPSRYIERIREVVAETTQERRVGSPDGKGHR